MTPETVDRNRPGSGSGCGCSICVFCLLVSVGLDWIGLDKKKGVEGCESDPITERERGRGTKPYAAGWGVVSFGVGG